MVAIKKVPLTLVYDATGEKKEFASTTEAAAFLGINPGSVARMKRNKGKIVNGWRVESGRIGRCMSKGAPTSERRYAAVKNFNSIDPDNPEDVKEFSSKAECQAFIRTHQGYRSRTIGGRDDRKLLNAIMEDDGIIDLDEE